MLTFVNNLFNNFFHGLWMYCLISAPRTGRPVRAAVSGAAAVVMTLNVLLLYRLGLIQKSAAIFFSYIITVLIILVGSLFLSRRDSRIKTAYIISVYLCIWGAIWLISAQATTLFAASDPYVLCAIRVIFNIILLPVYLIWLRKPLNNLMKTVLTGYVPMLIVSAMSFAVLTMFIILFYNLGFSLILFIAFLCLLIMVVCLQYIMFQYLVGLRKQTRFRQTEMRIRFLNEQLEIYRSSERNMRQARHDLRHHDRLIAGFAERGDLGGLRVYLSQYMQAHEAVLFSEPLCANKLADTVLSSFRDRAQKEGTKFEVSCAVPERLPFAETDLVVIIANILENALFACRGLPKPFVRYDMTVRDKKLIIECKNACRTPIRFLDGMPLSGTERGIGTSSIDDTVKKYGGNVRFSERNGVFFCLAILPLR